MSGSQKFVDVPYLLQNGQKIEVEVTPPEEPPSKPPEHIVDEAVVLRIASSQPVEGKTIAELAAMYIRIRRIMKVGLTKRGMPQITSLLMKPLSY
jgi:hypothetical protein